MPKDDYSKAKRGDIARHETARQGFEQREKQRENAKQQRDKSKRSQPSALHPKAEQIAAAEHRVDMLEVFYDRDILARMEAAAMGSANAFYDALVMTRRKMS